MSWGVHLAAFNALGPFLLTWQVSQTQRPDDSNSAHNYTMVQRIANNTMLLLR